MAINRFQGDPAIQITKDGANLPFLGGQPIVDAGLENAVLISLFTKNGWPGNVLFSEKESTQIGSDFETVASQPITVTSLNSIRQEALNALNWMIKNNLAQTIECVVTNPNGNIILVKILIKPPGEDALELNLTRNGINWQFQATFPASGQYA
jgi:phage gp46-like protein